MMRPTAARASRWAWMLLCALACATAAAERAPQPAIGGHGMVLFGGEDALYAAHLPMFHPPHDYQVVLRLQLEPPHDAALRRTLAAAPSLWTLDPERFDLTRLDPRSADPLRAFSARLVEGHFERGGATYATDVRVHVDAVLLFRRLDPARRTRAQMRYHVVGDGRERFLVKQIDARPDFDQIVAVDAGDAAAVQHGMLPRSPAPGPTGASLDAFVRELFGAAARVRGVVHADAQDLQ